MQAAKRVIKNTGILYARMAITVFLSLYTTRVILGALGAEDFGIFNLVGGTIAMLTFLNASMAAATQRFMSFAQGQGDEGRQHQIFNVSVVLHAGIALLVLALLEGAGFWLFNGIVKIEPERLEAAWLVYQFAAASAFFTILSVPYDAVINAREHMLLYAVLGVIEAVLKLAIALVVAQTAADKLELYGLLMAALSVVLLLLRIGYCHRKYHECKLALRRHFSRPLFKEMTAFAGWSFLGSSTSMLANYGQGLVLNMFFGARVNAAQGVANQVSGQLGVFAGNMLKALNPLIVKSEGAGERQLMLKASFTGSKVGFFLLMFFYVPVLIEMPYLLKLWLKEVPQYTVDFCSLLLLRNLVEQLFLTLVSSISAVGYIKNYQITSSVLTLFILPASFILFHAGYPPSIIYVVFLIYSIITSGVILFFAQRTCGLSICRYIRSIVLRCFLTFSVALGITAIPLMMMEQSFFRLILVGSLSILSFFATVSLMGFSQQERRLFKNIISLAMRKIFFPRNNAICDMQN